MAEDEHQNHVAEVIHEVNIQPGSENFGLCVDPAGVSHVPGIRRVGLRAEIDTSPPFGSVQEAVTRFGGRGYWVPFKLEDNYNGAGEFDIKRMEEHAAELEKDLIVKELETLDVLEALGSTKRIVEDLKRQLHQESLRSAEHIGSDIKEMNHEHCEHNPMSSPDLILMELKQAKINLGKTMDDLVMIQSSVESLNKKMKEEKDFLDKTRAKLTYGFGGAVSLAEELSRIRVKPQVPVEEERLITNNPPKEQVKMVAENDETGSNHLNKQHEPLDNLPKAVLKSNVSMRDVLRRKQVPKEEVVVPKRQSIEGQIPRRNANLSQMLKELKQDITFSARAEKDEVQEEKQFVTQRRKFGFIHITLPMHKQSKKKPSL